LRRTLARLFTPLFALAVIALWLTSATQPIQARVIDEPLADPRTCIDCDIATDLTWSELQGSIAQGMVEGAVAGAGVWAGLGLVGELPGALIGAAVGATTGAVIGGFVGFIGDLANQAFSGSLAEAPPAMLAYSPKALD